MTKSKSKYFIVIALIALISATFSHYLENNVSHIILFLLLGIFLFSIVVRKIEWFKPYFISKYNILTSKVRHHQEFDFSKEILFDKLIEVMQSAGFKIIQTNENTGDIFATSQISWSSWGENIYITLKEVNGKTTVDFCSACLFQVYSWGKNEHNYDNFMQEFEKSLTI